MATHPCAKLPHVCPKTGRRIESRPPRWLTWLVPLAGLAALVWFLIRVLPKPSRAAYPCQRVAAPVAASFVVYLLSLVGVVVLFRKARAHLRQARYQAAYACVGLGLIAAFCGLLAMPARTASADFTPTDPPNAPFGEAQGLYPGRVTWAHDPDATTWDGSASYWWDDTHINQTAVDQMLSNAVRWLTGAANDADAWARLFQHFNQTHGRGPVGYQPGETIAIKINLNNSWSQGDADNEIDASPQAIRALLRQLVHHAGVPQANITVYDAIRWMPDHIYDRCHPEFPSVRFVDREGGNGRIANAFVADVLHFSNGNIPSGSSEVARCVIEADYVINLSLLKRHGWCAPLTVCGKSHLGSLSGPGDLHAYIDASAPDVYDAQVDLIGHEDLGGKTLLFLLDGLFGGRDVVSIGAPWSMAPFNYDWPSSLLASQDPIAIDSVALDLVRTEMFYELWPNADRYLHEGALANNPASGVFYDPEGDGTRLHSLGVHEHWNNATNQQYSRDLGSGAGIALLSAAPTTNTPPTVTLDTPPNGTAFPINWGVPFQATATDTDGSVAQVEFFDLDAREVGADDTAPFEFTWTGASLGTHTLMARAVDDDGATAWSTWTTVFIAARGDVNCDGAIGFADINPFVTALVEGAAAYAAKYPGCHHGTADVSENGSVGFEDINPFVDLLVD